MYGTDALFPSLRRTSNASTARSPRAHATNVSRQSPGILSASTNNSANSREGRRSSDSIFLMVTNAQLVCAASSRCDKSSVLRRWAIHSPKEYVSVSASCILFCIPDCPLHGYQAPVIFCLNTSRSMKEGQHEHTIPDQPLPRSNPIHDPDAVYVTRGSATGTRLSIRINHSVDRLFDRRLLQ